MPPPSPPPRISDAEWEVMNKLWQEHPATAQELHDALSSRRDWSDRTVKTLLTRLVKKGVLGFEEDGRRYRYHPLVTRDDCLRVESRSFLDRVSAGSVSPLLAWFVKEGELGEEDIAELRRLLDEREEEAP